MELRSHARILKQSKWFIVVVTLLVGVTALLFAVYRPVTYKAVVNFDISFINRAETVDYQYGGFYDLRGAEIYTQHLMSWMRTPSIVAEVYEAAEIGYEIDNIGRFTNRFKTDQYSAQNFSVHFTDRNEETAMKLATAVGQVITGRAAIASGTNEQAIFAVEALEPVVAENEYNMWILTTIGVIAGLLLSLILVYLREYFRE